MNFCASNFGVPMQNPNEKSGFDSTRLRGPDASCEVVAVACEPARVVGRSGPTPCCNGTVAVRDFPILKLLHGSMPTITLIESVEVAIAKG